MGYSRRIDRLVRSMTEEDEEPRIQISLKLYESLALSLNDVSKATGQTKTYLLNNLIDIGLTELCEALQANRPDLVQEIREEPYMVYNFNPPSFYRSVRERFGEGVQIDIEDAIKEEEEKQNGVDSDR